VSESCSQEKAIEKSNVLKGISPFAKSTLELDEGFPLANTRRRDAGRVKHVATNRCLRVALYQGSAVYGAGILNVHDTAEV